MKQDRLDLILKYIVEDFTRTSEPVGSMNLIKDHNLPYSSATVRNDMAYLEKEGYLEKRHTSSGRVPSTKGLQYYLDHLKDEEIKGENATEGFEKEFAMVFRSKAQSFENMISKSCEVLSQVTSLATVSLGNEADNENLTSVTVTPLSSNAATVILLTDRGHVENKTFQVGKGSDMSSLEMGMKILNSRLQGTPIGQIEEKAKALEPILKAQIGKDTRLVMETFAEALLSFAKKRFHTYGVTKLLENPNYKDDQESFAEVLRVIEGASKMEETASGTENPGANVMLSPEANVAVVSQKISIPGMPETEFAVVGPKGMDYKRVMAALKYISSNLEKYFGPEGTDEDGGSPGSKKKTAKKGGQQ